MNSFIKTSTTLTVFTGGRPYTVESSHVNYAKIEDAVREGDWDSIPSLVNVAYGVQTALVNGKITDVTVDVDAGLVLYKGEPVHNLIATRILDFIREGFDPNPLILFLDNLYQNPSRTAINELYGFLEYGGNPITPDGHFLAYKRVRENYTSVHDGVTKNDIGTVLEMPRNQVDDQRDRTCSYGFHFCSHEYVQHFSGARLVVLKINPRDVVTIPSDYNNTKGRACRYEVIGELTDQYRGGDTPFWKSPLIADPESPNFTFHPDDYLIHPDDSESEADYDVVEDEFDDDDDFGPLFTVVAGCLADTNSQPSNMVSVNWPNGVQTPTGTHNPNVINGNVPVSSKPSTENPVRTGYNRGYEDGRKRRPQSVAGLSPKEVTGYNLGYKDGRGHKTRVFK